MSMNMATVLAGLARFMDNQRMPWTLSDPDKATALEAKFASLGIDFTMPGFCDLPAFLGAERTNPRLLEDYAAYIEARPYTEEYLTDARVKIELVARAVRAAIEMDGRLGACIDASMMIGRMLDRLGIWNYSPKTCMTIRYPVGSGLGPSYFYGIDTGRFDAPHAIVVAPPYYAIDVTAKLQYYVGNQASFIPEIVLMDEFHPGEWTLNDIASPVVRHSAQQRGLTLRRFIETGYGHMLEVADLLPGRKYISGVSGQAEITYVNVAVGGWVEHLDGLTGYQPAGRTALQIFEQDVLPHLPESI